MEESDVFESEDEVGDWGGELIAVEVDAGDDCLVEVGYDVAKETFVISTNVLAHLCLCNIFGIECD